MKSSTQQNKNTVFEVRQNGKLHDWVFDGPEHEIRKRLKDAGPYEEITVVENPRNYSFDFLKDLLTTKNCPDKAGFWEHIPSGEIYEIYELEPVMNQLCFWGPEHGINYNGATDTQSIWDTDEWQGHIPVSYYDSVGPWKFIKEHQNEQRII